MYILILIAYIVKFNTFFIFYIFIVIILYTNRPLTYCKSTQTNRVLQN